VISRFDRGDLTLSEEFLPSLAADAPLRLADRRSLDEYYVTGTAVSDGRLYAISAAYGTLMAIDLGLHRVAEAWTIPGLDRPVGLAIRGGEFYILGANGVVTVAHGGAPVAGR
jgi:disulfide bond formation protein DsbB